jgi:uncharacterized protein YaiI (UPF0178 family)
LTDIYVDGDACPVREEIYRVAARLRLNVFVVSNGSRPIRPPGTSNVSMVLVGDTADAADDWIAEHISAVDVCVTSDIPLASRCLKKLARVVSPTGKQLDASEHRQCAGWSRDSSASAGVGNEYRRARSVDQEGPLSVSQRARYGLAGCNARSGPQLSPFPRQVSSQSRQYLFPPISGRDQTGPGWHRELRRLDGTREKPDRLAFFVERMFGLTPYMPSGHLLLVESLSQCQAADGTAWRNVWSRDYVEATRPDTEATTRTVRGLRTRTRARVRSVASCCVQMTLLETFQELGIRTRSPPRSGIVWREFSKRR